MGCAELFRQVQSLPQALASINPYLLIVDHLANIFPQSDTVPLVRYVAGLACTGALRDLPSKAPLCAMHSDRAGSVTVLCRDSIPLGSQSLLTSEHAYTSNSKAAAPLQSILEAISKLDQHQVTGISHPALLPAGDSKNSASRPSLARCHGCGRTVLSSCCQWHQTACKFYTGKLATGIEQVRRPSPAPLACLPPLTKVPT